MTGTKIKVNTGGDRQAADHGPPRGAFCSPPSPKPSDMGNMPMIIARAVITTGRSRVTPA